MLSQAQVQPPLQEAHPTTQHRHRIMVLPAQAAWHLLKGHMSGSYEWFLLPPLPATAGPSPVYRLTCFLRKAMGPMRTVVAAEPTVPALMIMTVGPTDTAPTDVVPTLPVAAMGTAGARRRTLRARAGLVAKARRCLLESKSASVGTLCMAMWDVYPCCLSCPLS